MSDGGTAFGSHGITCRQPFPLTLQDTGSQAVTKGVKCPVFKVFSASRGSQRCRLRGAAFMNPVLLPSAPCLSPLRTSTAR